MRYNISPISATLFATVVLTLVVASLFILPDALHRIRAGPDERITEQISRGLERNAENLAEIARKISALQGRLDAAAASPGQRPAFQPYIWTQLYPDQVLKDGEWKRLGSGKLIARAVVAAGQDCPNLTIDGQIVATVPRGMVYPNSFPVTLCETHEPYLGGAAVSFGDIKLPARPEAAKRILVIGDTGCRVTFYTFQNCLFDSFGKGRWAFPKIAALASQAKDIDLVVHVGDYHYRERPCPAGQEAFCGTQDWGYNWASWEADFFDPARRLLAHAPWVFVRGNHENCARAGAGWTNFLWPTLREKRFEICEDRHRPYLVELAEGLSLAVLDIANSEDKNYYVGRDKHDRAALYADWIDSLDRADLGKHVWVAMQQPPWQWPTSDNETRKHAGVRDRTVLEIQRGLRLQTDDPNKPKVDLVLAGDTHIFQALRPEDGGRFPWVLISGMSGTKLDGGKDFEAITGAAGKSLALDPELADKLDRAFGEDEKKKLESRLKDQSVMAFAREGFGYTLLEQKDGAWRATMFDEQGREAFTCVLIPDGACQGPKEEEQP